MDASVIQHLKEAGDILGQSNVSDDLYKVINHLTDAITIQERNISALQSQIENHIPNLKKGE
jgi:hypothetical protein